MEQDPSNPQENAPILPLYQRPEVIQLAATDERLGQQLHGLELADRGRQISEALHTQMEQALTEYLQQVHPDIFPKPETE